MLLFCVSDGGLIAGIVIFVLFVIIVVIIILALLYKRHQRKTAPKHVHDDQTDTAIDRKDEMGDTGENKAEMDGDCDCKAPKVVDWQFSFNCI